MATRSSQVSREGEATCCHQNGRVTKSFGIKLADQPASQSQPARKRALTAERKRAASCTFFSLSLSILLLSLQNSATHIPFSGKGFLECEVGKHSEDWRRMQTNTIHGQM